MGFFRADDVQPLFQHQGGYLNSASVGLPPRATVEALHRATDDWATGNIAAGSFDEVVARCRASFAALAGVPPEWVTINSTASSLVGLVAASLPAGAEVLYPRDDFTSLLFPFLQRAEAGGLRVREVPLEHLASSIGPTTTLVAASAVQSADGRVADLDAIAAAARRHDALTIIDATQALGWLPLPAASFDFVLAAAYKWLMAPRGVALMTVRPEHWRRLRPLAPGWYAGDDIWTATYGAPLRLATTARRFDISPAWLCWTGAVPALDLVRELGVEAIRDHDVGLANAFRERIGLAPSNSAIVSLRGEGLAQDLRAAGLVIAERNGATRVSFHVYNTLDDVDRAAAAVSIRAA